MGRNSPSRPGTLLGGKNQGGDSLWQILDDSERGGPAKLGKHRRPSYANAQEEPLPRYD